MRRNPPVLAICLMLLALVLGLGTAPASAAPHGSGAHDGPLRQAMLATLDAGATAVIARVDDGHHVTRIAVGAARREPWRDVSGRDELRVGSITKTMVATVALQLVGEGRLRLGDTVEHWLPGLVPGGGEITVRMLLNHTSGIYNYTDDPDFLPMLLAHPYRHWSPRELVAIATAHDPLFPPGTGWSYSNTGYVVVGLILERATGRPLPALLAERVFGPLHLRHTYLATSGRFRGPYAHGYVPPSLTGAGYLDVSHWSPTLAWAAGAVVSNAPDLARFYSALMSGRVLRPWLLRQLTRTVAAGEGVRYGLGIARLSTPCGTVWGHDGGIPGYLSFAVTNWRGSRSAVVLVPTQPDEAIAAAAYSTLGVALCQMSGRPVPTSGATTGLRLAG